uniref:Uncharacterized protein n=1 Tax=Tanacetum cinerariifolium TaxID=118510 RepID=A0A699GF11_TANCI|nr:hypothetical protein [Tanacetum cinerariifolium]
MGGLAPGFVDQAGRIGGGAAPGLARVAQLAGAVGRQQQAVLQRQQRAVAIAAGPVLGRAVVEQARAGAGVPGAAAPGQLAAQLARGAAKIVERQVIHVGQARVQRQLQRLGQRHRRRQLRLYLHLPLVELAAQRGVAQRRGRAQLPAPVAPRRVDAGKQRGAVVRVQAVVTAVLELHETLGAVGREVAHVVGRDDGVLVVPRQEFRQQLEAAIAAHRLVGGAGGALVDVLADAASRREAVERARLPAGAAAGAGLGDQRADFRRRGKALLDGLEQAFGLGQVAQVALDQRQVQPGARVQRFLLDHPPQAFGGVVALAFRHRAQGVAVQVLHRVGRLRPHRAHRQQRHRQQRRHYRRTGQEAGRGGAWQYHQVEKPGRRIGPAEMHHGASHRLHRGSVGAGAAASGRARQGRVRRRPGPGGRRARARGRHGAGRRLAAHGGRRLPVRPHGRPGAADRASRRGDAVRARCRAGRRPWRGAGRRQIRQPARRPRRPQERRAAQQPARRGRHRHHAPARPRARNPAGAASRQLGPLGAGDRPGPHHQLEPGRRAPPGGQRRLRAVPVRCGRAVCHARARQRRLRAGRQRSDGARRRHRPAHGRHAVQRPARGRFCARHVHHRLRRARPAGHLPAGRRRSRAARWPVRRAGQDGDHAGRRRTGRRRRHLSVPGHADAAPDDLGRDRVARRNDALVLCTNPAQVLRTNPAQVLRTNPALVFALNPALVPHEFHTSLKHQPRWTVVHGTPAFAMKAGAFCMGTRKMCEIPTNALRKLAVGRLRPVLRHHQPADAGAVAVHVAGLRPGADQPQRNHLADAHHDDPGRVPDDQRAGAGAQLHPGAGGRAVRHGTQQAGVQRRVRAKPQARGRQRGPGAQRSDQHPPVPDRQRAVRIFRRAVVPDLPGRDLHFRAGPGRVRAVRHGHPGGAGVPQRAGVEKAAGRRQFAGHRLRLAGHQQPAQRRGDRIDGHAAQPDGPLVQTARQIPAPAGRGQREGGAGGGRHQVRADRAAIAGARLRRLAGAGKQDHARHDDCRLDPARPRPGAGAAGRHGTAETDRRADRGRRERGGARRPGDAAAQRLIRPAAGRRAGRDRPERLGQDHHGAPDGGRVAGRAGQGAARQCRHLPVEQGRARSAPRLPAAGHRTVCRHGGRKHRPLRRGGGRQGGAGGAARGRARHDPAPAARLRHAAGRRRRRPVGRPEAAPGPGARHVWRSGRAGARRTQFQPRRRGRARLAGGRGRPARARQDHRADHPPDQRHRHHQQTAVAARRRGGAVRPHQAGAAGAAGEKPETGATGPGTNPAAAAAGTRPGAGTGASMKLLAGLDRGAAGRGRLFAVGHAGAAGQGRADAGHGRQGRQPQDHPAPERRHRQRDPGARRRHRQGGPAAGAHERRGAQVAGGSGARAVPGRARGRSAAGGRARRQGHRVSRVAAGIQERSAHGRSVRGAAAAEKRARIGAEKRAGGRRRKHRRPARPDARPGRLARSEGAAAGLFEGAGGKHARPGQRRLYRPLASARSGAHVRPGQWRHFRGHRQHQPGPAPGAGTVAAPRAARPGIPEGSAVGPVRRPEGSRCPVRPHAVARLRPGQRRDPRAGGRHRGGPERVHPGRRGRARREAARHRAGRRWPGGGRPAARQPGRPRPYQAAGGTDFFGLQCQPHAAYRGRGGAGGGRPHAPDGCAARHAGGNLRQDRRAHHDELPAQAGNRPRQNLAVGGLIEACRSFFHRAGAAGARWRRPRDQPDAGLPGRAAKRSHVPQRHPRIRVRHREPGAGPLGAAAQRVGQLLQQPGGRRDRVHHQRHRHAAARPRIPQQVGRDPGTAAGVQPGSDRALPPGPVADRLRHRGLRLAQAGADPAPGRRLHGGAVCQHPAAPGRGAARRVPRTALRQQPPVRQGRGHQDRHAGNRGAAGPGRSAGAGSEGQCADHAGGAVGHRRPGRDGHRRRGRRIPPGAGRLRGGIVTPGNQQGQVGPHAAAGPGGQLRQEQFGHAQYPEPGFQAEVDRLPAQRAAVLGRRGERDHAPGRGKQREGQGRPAGRHRQGAGGAAQAACAGGQQRGAVARAGQGSGVGHHAGDGHRAKHQGRRAHQPRPAQRPAAADHQPARPGPGAGRTLAAGPAHRRWRGRGRGESGQRVVPALTCGRGGLVAHAAHQRLARGLQAGGNRVGQSGQRLVALARFRPFFGSDCRQVRFGERLARQAVIAVRARRGVQFQPQGVVIGVHLALAYRAAHGAVGVAHQAQFDAAQRVADLAQQLDHHAFRAQAVQFAGGVLDDLQAVFAARALHAADAQHHAALALVERECAVVHDQFVGPCALHQLQHQFALALHRLHGAQLDMVGQAALAGGARQHHLVLRGQRSERAQALAQDEAVVLGQQRDALRIAERVAEIGAEDFIDHARMVRHQVGKQRRGVQQLQPAVRGLAVQQGARGQLDVVAQPAQARQTCRGGVQGDQHRVSFEKQRYPHRKGAMVCLAAGADNWGRSVRAFPHTVSGLYRPVPAVRLGHLHRSPVRPQHHALESRSVAGTGVLVAPWLARGAAVVDRADPGRNPGARHAGRPGAHHPAVAVADRRLRYDGGGAAPRVRQRRPVRQPQPAVPVGGDRGGGRAAQRPGVHQPAVGVWPYPCRQLGHGGAALRHRRHGGRGGVDAADLDPGQRPRPAAPARHRVAARNARLPGAGHRRAVPGVRQHCHVGIQGFLFPVPARGVGGLAPRAVRHGADGVCAAGGHRRAGQVEPRRRHCRARVADAGRGAGAVAAAGGRRRNGCRAGARTEPAADRPGHVRQGLRIPAGTGRERRHAQKRGAAHDCRIGPRGRGGAAPARLLPHRRHEARAGRCAPPGGGREPAIHGTVAGAGSPAQDRCDSRAAGAGGPAAGRTGAAQPAGQRGRGGAGPAGGRAPHHGDRLARGSGGRQGRPPCRPARRAYPARHAAPDDRGQRQGRVAGAGCAIVRTVRLDQGERTGIGPGAEPGHHGSPWRRTVGRSWRQGPRRAQPDRLHRRRRSVRARRAGLAVGRARLPHRRVFQRRSLSAGVAARVARLPAARHPHVRHGRAGAAAGTGAPGLPHSVHHHERPRRRGHGARGVQGRRRRFPGKAVRRRQADRRHRRGAVAGARGTARAAAPQPPRQPAGRTDAARARSDGPGGAGTPQPRDRAGAGHQRAHGGSAQGAPDGQAGRGQCGRPGADQPAGKRPVTPAGSAPVTQGWG